MTRTGQGRGKRFVAGAAVAVLCFAILCGVARLYGVLWNVSASYPRGFWRVIDRTPHKGDMVMFRAPLTNPVIRWGLDNAIVPQRLDGDPVLLKRIVAEPGDRIELTDHVLVNGVVIPNSRIFSQYSTGGEIPTVATSGLVPAGTWFLMSDYAARSFDSRYFGPIAQDAVLGVAVPLWTW